MVNWKNCCRSLEIRCVEKLPSCTQSTCTTPKGPDWQVKVKLVKLNVQVVTWNELTWLRSTLRLTRLSPPLRRDSFGICPKAKVSVKASELKVNELKFRNVVACCPASPFRLTLRNTSEPFWKLKNCANVPLEWNETMGPLA